MSNQRNQNIDTLRSVAALMVLMLHVSAPYVSAGKSTGVFNADFWTGNVLDAFFRICVPLFVMISGMFLLGRRESITDQLKKRSLRILTPLVFWSFMYLVFQRWMGNLNGFHPTNAYLWEQAMAGNPFYHLWYLFMVTGLYLVAPLINQLTLRLSRKALWLLSVAFLVIGMIRYSINQSSGHTPFFMSWFVDYLGYFLIGYLLSTSKGRANTRVLLGVYLVSGGLIAALSPYTIREYNNLYFYGYLTPLVIVGALCFFKAFQTLTLGNNILARLAPLSFGVYLVHAGILDVLNNLIRLKYLQLSSVALIDIPIKCLIVLLISLAIVYPMSKSRLFKQLI